MGLAVAECAYCFVITADNPVPKDPSFFFFLSDPAPPETYPLPLPDPLPIPADAPEPLPEPLRRQHNFLDAPGALHEIPFPADLPGAEQARRRFVYEELLLLQLALALRRREIGRAHV